MNHERQIHRVRRSLAAAAAVALVLGACGSDDTADGGDPDIEVAVTDAAGAVDSAVDDAVDEAESGVSDLAETLRNEGLDSAASVVEQIDVAELAGEGDFTFFAPSDEAFTSLSADDMADLLSDPSQILETLRNHTLEGTVTAEDLASMDSVESRAGETLQVDADGDDLMIDDVAIVTTDVEFAGGVIHVVDGFLLTS